MKLNQLLIDHFQGINHIDICLGNKTSIYGDNATGKTTIFNAFTWLLTGKSGNGSKGFNPKPIEKDDEMHNVNTYVQAEFENDGKIFTISKNFHETYKKKRGSSHEEFTGHTTEHFFNEVPVKEADYNKKIEELFGNQEEILMLTMPNYFSDVMDWAERRTILIDLVGDVSADDVISGNDDLKELPGIIGDFTIDEYLAMARVTRKTINKKLEEIPSRIDEVKNSIPEIEGKDKEEIIKEIERLESEKEKVFLQQSDEIQSSNDVNTLKRKRSEIEAKLAEANAKYMKDEGSKRRKVIEDIEKDLKSLKCINKQIEDLKEDKEKTLCSVMEITEKRNELIKKYKEQQAVKWDHNNDTCPTCGRVFPEDQIEKLIEDFNKNKSDRLLAINAEGKKYSKDIIKQVKNKAAEIDVLINELMDKTDHLDITIKEKQESIPEGTFKDTDIYKSLSTELEKLNNGGNNTQQATDEIKKKYAVVLGGIAGKLQELRRSLAVFEAAESQEERLVELEKQEKELSIKYEEFEKGIYLCELFNRYKADMLTESINKQFKTVKIRLFVNQINGGLKETCDVLIPSPDGNMIAYKDANNAARINAGLEIINTLSSLKNKHLPVFVDNAEAVTNIINTDNQVVRLIVSADDKILKIECED